jgi:hypothetical protein
MWATRLYDGTESAGVSMLYFLVVRQPQGKVAVDPAVQTRTQVRAGSSRPCPDPRYRNMSCKLIVTSLVVRTSGGLTLEGFNTWNHVVAEVEARSCFYASAILCVGVRDLEVYSTV